MTVIAAWKDANNAWIGGDSGAFEEDEPAVAIGSAPKVWRADGNLLGVGGSYRIGEIARASRIGDPYKLRDYLISAADPDNEGGHAFPEDSWTVLIVNKNGVYELNEDFAVIRFREHYGAAGTNTVATLSAFYALEPWSMDGRRRIELVMGGMVAHSMYARKPFKILRLSW